MGIFTNFDQRQILVEIAVLSVLDGASHKIAWGEHFHHAFIVADQRGVIFVEQRRNQQDHHHGKHHIGRAQANHVPPRAGFIDAHKAHENGRQNTQQQQP
ncbi:hypothetical protein D3C71_1522320 [compost metagenome]